MAVPEAPSDLNHLAQTWQNNVGFSRQVLAVKSESITHRVDQSSNHQFGAGVFATNQRHLGASVSVDQRAVAALRKTSNREPYVVSSL